MANSLPKVLRIYRAERDLTQLAAAKKFKVSAATWSKLEDGTRHPSPLLAAKLVQATGATWPVVLGLEAIK